MRGAEGSGAAPLNERSGAVDHVVITDATSWKVSKGATGVPTTLTSSGTLAKDLVVGDFDGNGSDDILYANDSTFRVKYSGTGGRVR